MSIRIKIIILLIVIASIASIPLGLFLQKKQEMQILQSIKDTGKTNSQMLAYSMKAILLMNGGEILSSRVDSAELIATFKALKKNGLKLAETIILSENENRNGIILNSLSFSKNNNSGNNSGNKIYTRKQIVNLLNGKSFSLISCPGGEEECYQFINTCKVKNLKPFCLVKLLMSKDVALAPVKELKKLIYMVAGSTLLLAIFIGIIFSNLLTRPLNKLMKGVAILGSGKLDYEVKINSKDEIGKLSKSFNEMASNLEKKIDEINKTNEAYQRFVPVEFLKFLNRESIIDIELGDQTQKEMTIFFTDIRSFSSISETMSPEENFLFINSYLHEVGPVIRNYGGFIDKYIGDAIMGLFPGNPENAVEAALTILEKLKYYNEKRIKNKQIPIKIGIGIHTGPIMLGIIGEKQRREGTVISDSVNLASRLESLTKLYGSEIVISKSTFHSIKTNKKIHSRFLDKVSVKGKKQATSIFEIISDTSELQKRKISYSKEFENALELIYSQKFEDAKKALLKLYHINPEDKAVRLHYKRVLAYIENGVPDNWDGIAVLKKK